MAGNKTIFETAMKRAHEYAWSNQWERAMKEYQRALKEFPNDRTAQRNLAQCQFRLKYWPQALVSYEKLNASDPTDAFAINRLAEIYLALGQQERAFETYYRLADLYMSNNQLHEAQRALKDLARAIPKKKSVHLRLLDLATELGDTPGQAAEHVALSQITLEEGGLGEAQQHADAAAALDPEDPDVRKWSQVVRRKLAENAGTVSLAGSDLDLERGEMALGTSLLPRVEVEPQQAIELAERAAEAAERGEYRLAVDLYDQSVRAGATRPSVFYSAGVLNYQIGRAEQAVPFLERAMQDREFAMSASYVLGQCQAALKNLGKAVLAFEKAIGLLEIDKITRGEADEVIELYTAAAETNVKDHNPGRAASLYSSLVNIFKTRKWSHPRLAEIEKKADEFYKASIKSKLDGISRGSAALDPGRLDGEETTRIADEHDLDGTSKLGSTTRIKDDSGDDPTTRLSSSSADMATTVMPPPGGNLRTITEYLRASESRPAEPAASLTGESDGTHALPAAAPTRGLPLPPPPAPDIAPVPLPATVLAHKEEQEFRVQLMIAEGEHAMAEQMWSVAVDCCFSVINTQPDYLPIHMMLGDIYLHQGKVADAVAKYQTVMETYMARQDSASAAEVCERLLQLEPENPALQTRLGVLLMDAGRVDDAARALLAAAERLHQSGDTPAALQEALGLRETLPNSSDVVLAVGTYRLMLGQITEAAGDLSQALHLAPGNNIALVRLYVCLVLMRDDAQWDALQSLVERAATSAVDMRLFIEELHDAIRDHNHPTLFYALAVLATRAGLDDVAADALDQGILLITLNDESERTPELAQIEALMAETRADMAINTQEWGLAVRHYTHALELLNPQPDGTVALASPRAAHDFARIAEPVQLYYGLAEAFASQNNWEGALRALQQLKQLIPEDHGVHTRLADIYFRQGHLTKALGELNELLIHYQKVNENEKTLETLGQMARLAPNNVPVRRKLSDLYLKLGMTDYGLAELNTLAELQLKAGLVKDAMAAYQKAADLYYTLGNHDRAISIYEKVVRIAPRDLTARDQLVNMYVQSGRLGEAIESERSLADLFIQEGRTEEAIAALHQLLALSPQDVGGHHMLAKQLTAIGEYGQAARLYGRLARLDPHNESIPHLQREMQRLADDRSAISEAGREDRKTSVAPPPGAKAARKSAHA